MEFKKNSKTSTEIPTSSMPDIVFMLLLFFMVSTVFRQSSGIPLDLPAAKKIEKLEAKTNVVNIWADGKDVSIDDKLVRVTDLRSIVYGKYVANPKLIISLKIDRSVEMHILTSIHSELREAGALKVNYCAKFGV